MEHERCAQTKGASAVQIDAIQSHLSKPRLVRNLPQEPESPRAKLSPVQSSATKTLEPTIAVPTPTIGMPLLRTAWTWQRLWRSFDLARAT
jgi:hypothetical protein